MQVGTAELRNRLSYFLGEVRRGARFVVTDRGHPVAELVPVASPSDLSGRIEALVRDRVVTAEPTRHRADVRAVALHLPGVSVSRVVAAMRNER